MFTFNKRSLCAFTLIEILIALFIYTIIITIVSVALANMLNSSNESVKDIMAFNRLQRAILLLQRDFVQTVKRPVRDSHDKLLPAFVFPSPEKPLLLSFSAYISNPLFPKAHTSDIQRVGYRYQHHKLYRITWPVLDRVKSAYDEKVILDNIKRLSWRFVDENQIYYTAWPPAITNRLVSLPVAVELSIVFNNGNQIEKLFVL